MLAFCWRFPCFLACRLLTCASFLLVFCLLFACSLLPVCLFSLAFWLAGWRPGRAPGRAPEGLPEGPREAPGELPEGSRIRCLRCLRAARLLGLTWGASLGGSGKPFEALGVVLLGPSLRVLWRNGLGNYFGSHFAHLPPPQAAAERPREGPPNEL